MIRRVNAEVEAPVDFKGGPQPRIPDSLFVPTARLNMLPFQRNTFVVNDMFGFQAYLRNHHIPRVVPFNIVHGNTIIQQPQSRQNTRNRNLVTKRSGAPANLSYVVPPVI
jgi:hypothetical protein